MRHLKSSILWWESAPKPSEVTAAAAAGPGAAIASSAWRWWAPTLAALGFYWLLLLNQQRLEWTVNPVYSYGWVVPALAGYLFWELWVEQPAAGPRLHFRWFAAGAGLLLAGYLPVRVIQEANPDWVKINWIMAGLWAGLAWIALMRTGGAAWAGHFLPALVFCFTALPWPIWLQDALSRQLMALNAAAGAEILTMLGTPAVAQGNLIQVADQWVNVEEACSGIRSLQAAFMMALFLGQFYRMGWGRRGGLLLASLAVAFAVNLLRTVVLAGLAPSGGADRWHDRIGTLAMVVCLGTLWLLAERLKPSGRIAPADRPRSAPDLRPPFSWRGAALVGLWLVLAEGVTWAWYDFHEQNLPPSRTWSVHWPRQAPAFAEGQFAGRMSALLKFDEGATASWETADGCFWQMYYLRWRPGRVSRFLSSAHYPTVCLPATGLTLVSETGVWDCPVGDTGIPFTTYLFDEGGHDVYVFHAVVEDRPAATRSPLDYRQVTTSERLASVRRGERNLGQRVLGIAVRGALSPSAARAMVTQTLGGMLEIKSAGPGPRTVVRS